MSNCRYHHRWDERAKCPWCEIDNLTTKNTELEELERKALNAFRVTSAKADELASCVARLTAELAEMKERAEGELPSYTEQRCAVENAKLKDQLAELSQQLEESVAKRNQLAEQVDKARELLTIIADEDGWVIGAEMAGKIRAAIDMWKEE